MYLVIATQKTIVCLNTIIIICGNTGIREFDIQGQNWITQKELALYIGTDGTCLARIT